jgi:antitoxin component YwqK of YwqJK toxin-antitoxin module
MRHLCFIIASLAISIAHAQQGFTYDTAARTLVFYDWRDNHITHTVQYQNFISLNEQWTFYYDNGKKEQQFTKCDSIQCDTLKIWAETGMLSEVKIYNDSGYTRIDYWSGSNQMYEKGSYVRSHDSSKSRIIRDSTNFLIYESVRCNGDCFKRVGTWFTFHPNGQLESEGKYLPDEYTVTYPTRDSAGIAVIIQKTNFDSYPYQMGIVTIGYAKDGIWTYYNDQGKLIREEYYEGGLLRNTIQY